MIFTWHNQNVSFHSSLAVISIIAIAIAIVIEILDYHIGI